MISSVSYCHVAYKYMPSYKKFLQVTLCFGRSHISTELTPNIHCLTPRKTLDLVTVVQKRCCKVLQAQVHTFNTQGREHRLSEVSCDLIDTSLLTMSNIERPDTQSQSCSGVFDITSEPGNSVGVDVTCIPNDGASPEAKRRQPTYPMEAQIPHSFRYWEPIDKTGRENESVFKFKVISYNVLAQYLLERHPYLYRRCATHCLQWKFRSKLLLQEITQLSPDILCLQEVQCSHIETFYKQLEGLGYVGVFKQKTGSRQDGCAIYFKNSVFKMRNYISVEYYQPTMPLLNRDNIGILVELVPRQLPKQPLVVATTHLLFNPRRTDVRLAQLQLLLAEIDRFAYSTKTGQGLVPIILTGDLNSTPDSAVIQLLSNGSVSAKQYRAGYDWSQIGLTNDCQHLAVHLSRERGHSRRLDNEELRIHHTFFSRQKPVLTAEEAGNAHAALFNSDVVRHSLRFRSVYEHFKPDGQPEASTFQNEWLAVDYIYYSHENRLSLSERLYMPTAAECVAMGRLPNNFYGSDHLALGAVFQLYPHQQASVL